MLRRRSTRTLVTVVLNCAVLLWCVWLARDVAPAAAPWWPVARVAAAAAALASLGCAALLLARLVSWLTGHPAPHAGRPSDH